MEDIKETPPTAVKKQTKKLSKRDLTLSRFRRRLLSRHVWLVRAGIVVSFLIVFVLVIFGVRLLLKKTGADKYLHLAKVFVLTPMENINTHSGRTNILVLGKAGEGHPGPDLTDTMILVSVSHENNPQISMVSLPRDIWIEDLRAKLNSAYYWGNKKKENGGMVLAKSTVEEISGVPVHYAIIIDFAGFTRLIDTLGGIDVDVEKSFTDDKFPIPGRENDECEGDPEYLCRYETIHFEAGMQHMDGTTALKFVRSRHSEDLEEGTDISRSRRQQRVLEGIKRRVFSSDILLSPKKLLELKDAVIAMTETDMDEESLVIVAKRIYQSRDDISSNSIPEGMLTNPPISEKYDNQYVFVPTAGDWSEVQNFIQSILPGE